MFELSSPDSSSDGPGIPAIQGHGLVWYAQETVRVVRLDTEAIRRVSRDPSALAYGAIAVLLATSVQIAALLLMTGVTTPKLAALAIAPAISLLGSAISTGVVHGAARFLFGATGSYVAVLRVIWLGSIVGCFSAVPVVGPIVGGLWSLLIMMVTFQEVDGIERMQALAIAIGLSAGVFLLNLLVS